MSILHKAKFLTSAAKLHQLPPEGPPEVCFVGRSNSGKSSAINILTNQKRLAFSSKTPGRTRLINYFSIEDSLNPGCILGSIVDLPGYGFAAIDQKMKDEWSQVLSGYLQHRQSIAGIVLMMDIRRGLTQLDKQLLQWIGPTGKPVLILLTKADKLPYGQRCKAIQTIHKDLSKDLHTLPKIDTIAFSSTHKMGIEETKSYIEQWISPQYVA
ncbi:MAG: ribosome biogenesis GTP-binding protein YihA/YsxC [Alcaligenaceae bacterium]|nr:ribosome biogenesis GTP-binding protein YihA/YsxC [Alcaligenaceae bacterium]